MIPKYEKLVASFKKSHPKLTVTSVIDFDKRYLVIEALENLNKNDFSDPLYAIDKQSGKVYNYSPAGEYDKFFDAITNRMIYSVNTNE